MKLNMQHWVEEIINSSERKVLPIMTYPGLKLANKQIMDVVRDGASQAQCIEALSHKYPSIAAVTIMDLSVEAEAFGSPIQFTENEVPSVIAAIVNDSDEADILKIPEIGAGRTGMYITAAELAAKNITDKPVFGGIIGPMSLAGRLMDMTEIMVQMITEPETVHRVLDKCTRFLVEYGKAYKNKEVNGLIIAEPAAGLLSPEMCTEFSSEYVKNIVDALQDENFMIILHNCGNTEKLVPSLLSTGAMGYHFGNVVDMADIMPQIPDTSIAFGNIEPAGGFRNGTTELMRTRVNDLLEKTAGYRNFVLSSGCDVPPQTPIENVEAFYDALVQYNSRR
ncbi:MAG: methylcobamide--CoM methyltransferase [Spirochaetae bacterium HGW-Spirochaetae-1]|jgi:uroporphyrinogen decarboxylase|nr:MAG: methylcobamide--CoM methyltransferase [Spirochaetae bacterium HGW-Spirochaetae-1]